MARDDVGFGASRPAGAGIDDCVLSHHPTLSFSFHVQFLVFMMKYYDCVSQQAVNRFLEPLRRVRICDE